jgi:hypothetical protein
MRWQQVRLWTIHPKYLDLRGLVAVWREALLAQKVLRGQTVGYRAHPQLIRFRIQPRPVTSVAQYLLGIYAEAVARGYRFDSSRIGRSRSSQKIVETEGQLLYEWELLKDKLQMRSPEQFVRIRHVTSPEPHPLFTIIRGDVREWERVRVIGSSNIREALSCSAEFKVPGKS